MSDILALYKPGGGIDWDRVPRGWIPPDQSGITDEHRAEIVVTEILYQVIEEINYCNRSYINYSSIILPRNWKAREIFSAYPHGNVDRIAPPDWGLTKMTLRMSRAVIRDEDVHRELLSNYYMDWGPTSNWEVEGARRHAEMLSKLRSKFQIDGGIFGRCL